MTAKIRSDANGDKFTQSLKVEAGAHAQNITQTTNIYTDSDTSRLQHELTTVNERHWHDSYKRLRFQANTGYFEIVQDPIAEIVTEIEQYEAQETIISTELKAKIYRLAAASHLPRYTAGDPQRCSDYLSQALTLSLDDDLIRCQITQALLQYDTGEVTAALETLSDISTDEALRLRFSIYFETNQINQCQRMVDNGSVDLAWGKTDSKWARAIMGYYTITNNKEAALETANLLVKRDPTTSSYTIVAHSLLRLANARLHTFCQTHDMFLDFYLGLDLSDLIDHDLQFQAAKFFAKAGELYEQHNCLKSAVHMYSNAVHLCLDEEGNKENLAEWVSALTRLDSQNYLLKILKRPEFDLAEDVGSPPTLLDFFSLVNDTAVAPVYILKMAEAVANTDARAIEVADILKGQFERFQATGENFTHYIFTVLRLWQQGGDLDRALALLEGAALDLPYPRLEPLLYIWLHSKQEQFDLALDWLAKALAIAPKHPQVLAFACVVHYQLQNYQQILDYAQTLFEIVRTRQTVKQYLAALWHTNQAGKILDVLGSVNDVGLDERYIRENRVRTLIRLGRLVDARDDLEWIRGSGLAEPFHLLNLGGSYQLLGDEDQAVTVLRECINQFPHEVEAYLALSYVYLHTGRTGQSFSWALKAAQTFPDDPKAALHLQFISYPTGKELLSEVGEAFLAFLPGGRFAEQSPFIQVSMDELPVMAHEWQEKGIDITKVYRSGKITWLMLCLWRNVLPFKAHYEMSQYGRMTRYIAQGEQTQDIARLIENCPRYIVLDYTAWLSIWSLFDSGTLNVLSQYFERVYMPSALRYLLVEEQNRLATFGQLARYKAQCTVRDALNRWANKVIWHDEANLERGRDLSGSHFERTVAAENNLVYLNEHLSPNELIPATAIGIAALADLLAEAGEIDLFAQQSLKQNKHPIREQELYLTDRLKKDRQLVISIFTLVSWAMYDKIDSLFDYLDQIHLARPAYNWLVSEIAAYEFGQHTLEAFRGMRQLIYQGEESGLIVFETIPVTQYRIRQAFLERQTVEPDEDERLDSAERALFDYYDELVGIAAHRDLPIWTDDRFTKAFNIDGKRPSYAFGTDSFLAFAHNHPETAERISREEYHIYYGRLVDWGYYFLPINPEHILWHLQQGRNVSSKPLSNPLQHYRERVTDFWKFVKETLDVNEKAGTQLLGAYQGQLIITLYRLYAENISVDVGATVFAELDLSRHADALVLGNEPMFFASLFIHASTAELVSPEDREKGMPSEKRLLDYSHWLTQVILQSGVSFEVLDEAWYQLIRYPLAMMDEAQDDTQHQVGLLYLDRMLNLVPVHTISYLLTTDIGSRLQDEFGLEVIDFSTFRVQLEPRGDLEIRLPAKEWNRDYELAIGGYLQQRSEQAVSVGVVTLKAGFVAPGSFFLKTTVLPTEIYKQYAEVRGTEQIVFLLPDFGHPDANRRDALWRIGLKALQQHHITTDDWIKQRNDLVQEGSAGQEAGKLASLYLLGKWSIAQTCLAQAVQLHPDTVLQLLNFIKPIVVRDWLSLPAINWTAVDDLAAWAAQLPISIHSDQPGVGFLNLLSRYGYSLFPDAPIIRHRLLELGTNLPEAGQLASIQLLLDTAEMSVSLNRKASIALLVRDWLSSAVTSKAFDQHSLDTINERFLGLIAQVLRGWLSPDEDQTEWIHLELLLCRWLYQTWMIAKLDVDDDVRLELAYLATVAAGLIADMLFAKTEVTGQMVAVLNKNLLKDINSLPLQLRPEPQPSGYYRPALRDTLNYGASYLLHGLLSDEKLLPDPSHDALKGAALRCGATHRIQEVFLSGVSKNSTWLDGQLVFDISDACVSILGDLTKLDLVELSEADVYRTLVASSPDSAIAFVEQRIDTIPSMETEEEILQQLNTFFLGRVQPNTAWFELLSYLLADRKVLNRIRNFPRCYGEFLANIGLITIEPNEHCSPDLLGTIHDLLTEIPNEKNSRDLIEVKTYVLSQLLPAGLDIDIIYQWLQHLAKDEYIDLAVKRLALRPFILMWKQYSSKIRDSLFNTLIELAQLPVYKGLWEFARLARDKERIDGGP